MLFREAKGDLKKTEHGCERYYAHSHALRFHERGSDLAERIERALAEDGPANALGTGA